MTGRIGTREHRFMKKYKSMGQEMFSIGQSLWSSQRLIPWSSKWEQGSKHPRTAWQMDLWKEDSSHKEVGRGSLRRDNSTDFEVSGSKRNKVQREETTEAWRRWEKIGCRESAAGWQPASAELRMVTVREEQSGSVPSYPPSWWVTLFKGECHLKKFAPNIQVWGKAKFHLR